MMSASEFEITDSAHKEPQKRRAKQEEPNARAKYNFKDGLLALGKNEGKAQGWRPTVKGGAHSYAGPQRKSPVKMEAERTGACSPEYNIYSDSDVMASEDGSPQKEGGSAERSRDGSSKIPSSTINSSSAAIYGNPAEAKPRQNISENRLAQNGGNIVHQKPTLKKRVPGMINDLHPGGSAADEEEEENKIKMRKALEAKQPPLVQLTP